MPALVEPEKVAARPPRHRQSLGRRVAPRALRFLAIAAVAILITGGWYLGKKGFGRQWRLLVVEELRKRGVEAAIGKLTLDPFRGLVAQNVRIFDHENRANTLAQITEIRLDVNYAALLHRQPFLNAVDIRDAEATLVLPPAEGQASHAQLRNFRARIYLPPEQIHVSQAEGVFAGIRISLTGQLLKPSDYKPAPQNAEEWRKRMSLLQRVTTELGKFEFPAGPPTLQIKFSGNIADIEEAHAEATLRGGRISRGDYEARDLVVAAEWSNKALSITEFEWKDALGGFSGQASWNGHTGETDFQARSTLNLTPLLVAFGFEQFVKGITFPTSPLIEVSGTARLSQTPPEIKIVGHAAAADFTYNTIPLSDFAADFSWDGEHTALRSVRVRHESGELAADAVEAPGDFRLNIDSTISPAVFSAFLSPELQKFLREWEWQRPPDVHLRIRGDDRQPSSWKGEGRIALDRTRFRGVWMKNATANVHFGDGAVTYENFRVTREEGIATGTFTYDFKNHEVRLANIKSSLRPVEVIYWIDPKQLKNIAPYQFRRAPAITANGVYQFAGGKETRLAIDVDASAGMDYVFLKQILPVERASAKLLFTHEHLKIGDLAAVLLSGKLDGEADISLKRGDPRYKASLAVDAIDFPAVTGLYFNYKAAQGGLSGRYEFTGFGDDPRTMEGKGRLEVTNGEIFSIPIFGPLSDILGSLLPGTGYSIARKAGANFDIKAGVLHTGDFEVSGRLFSMIGHGDVHFLDDKLDFDVRINPKGPGILLRPAYKLFEYKGEGSLKKPNWRLKRF